MDQREKDYLELLTKRFDESKYIDFVKDLLNFSQFDISNNPEEKKDIPKQYKDYIDYYKYIAKYNDGLNNISVLIVKLKDNSSTNAKSSQRNFIATILSKYDLDASLVAFYSDTENNWRLSFVKKELNFTEKGFKIELTPAKRYSYLVGENESVHTAQEFLLKLLRINDRKIKLEDIEQVFDVEKVTKKFFEEYKEKYLQLKEYLDKNEDFKTESEKSDFTSVEFAKKLMGQIVFLYFLQKKGWLGVQLVPNELNLMEFDELYNNSDSVARNLLNKFYEKQEEFYVINRTKLRTPDSVEDIINLTNLFSKTSYDKPWGTGGKDFIRSIYKQAIKEHKNFFDDYLEPFFYRGLNEKRENQYFPLFNCKIPFLNGGLFEPINNYRWSSAYFNIPNTIFSNDEKDGILDFLDLYNFTIDEEEPLEKDIAVDPEMLGKIFENLLDVDDRKSKGAFYTPREIVYYMCQESLANYLVNKVSVNYNEVIEFIKYGDLISHIDWEASLNNQKDFLIGKTIYDNIFQIDKALIDVKIADPAVGSGAFPLGMLNEIVKTRNNISTYLLIQNDLGIINIDELYGTEHGKRDIYDMKLQTIENCIYAVDIETSAIDIAKLRLWLSLIVDYPNTEEPKPLPNLDCKIMQGNSLIDEYQGVPLFSEKMLSNNLKNYKRNDSKTTNNNISIQLCFDNDYNNNINSYMETMLNLQKEYFTTFDNKRKKELKAKIDIIQMGLVEESLKNDTKKLESFKIEAKKRQKPWFIWKLEFFDVFKNNNGFDIVIGNPPYGANIDNFTEIYAKKYPKTSKGYKDIYKYFINISLSTLLCEKGVLCFITPNTYFNQPRYKDVRELLLDYNINNLVNLGSDVFDATVLTSIMLVTRYKDKNNILKYSDVSINSKYTRNIENLKFENILQNCYKQNSDLSFIKPSYQLQKGEVFFEDVVIPKDAGINYQRVKVGLSEKGKSDLGDRLLYTGIKENENDIEYWKGVDIDEFKLHNHSNKYCRPYIKLKENERVIINKEYFNITPKILWRQTAPYPISCFDNIGVWFGRSIQGGIISDEYKDIIDEKYICCLLNSNFIRYTYIKSVDEVGRVFPQVKLEKLRKLPIKIIKREQQKYFVNLYDILSNNEGITKENYIKELNSKVYQLYDLSDEMIKQIEKFFNTKFGNK